MVAISLSLFIGAVVVLSTTEAFPNYRNNIPNGFSVTNPCNRAEVISGVGHNNKNGGGPRNNFGNLFAQNGRKWTTDLCNADSDNDGLSNGDELGDPDCVWIPGTTPSRTVNITHPAINNNQC